MAQMKTHALEARQRPQRPPTRRDSQKISGEATGEALKLLLPQIGFLQNQQISKEGRGRARADTYSREHTRESRIQPSRNVRPMVNYTIPLDSSDPGYDSVRILSHNVAKYCF